MTEWDAVPPNLRELESHRDLPLLNLVSQARRNVQVLAAIGSFRRQMVARPT
ncbi:MAG: hypothetical protein M5U26_09795 [Planctomycetota bacterium]|nr:hypothetical protein [Planctomycetota bacterium]